MPTLKYTKDDEDMKFLLYCIDPKSEFIESESLVLESDQTYQSLDEIATALFTLFSEESNPRKIGDFKKFRKAPTTPKPEFTLLNIFCYINLVRDALTTGSLKNKESIDKYTKVLLERNIKFDPDFLLLEIRSGLITSIENAEGLDKLYCERVLSNGEYFICSGLRQVYNKEDLLNNTYLFLLNIKKVKFKTLESEGMICCTEGNRVEAIKTENTPGVRIELENQLKIFSDITYGKVDLSKNTFKQILGDFKIVNHHLTFREQKVTLNGKYITTETENGPVR
jgi:tRNA-binding EMAP/Myf-like protein